MDIKGFFDTIDHDLLMRAVEKHVQESKGEPIAKLRDKTRVGERDQQYRADHGNGYGNAESPVFPDHDRKGFLAHDTVSLDVKDIELGGSDKYEGCCQKEGKSGGPGNFRRFLQRRQKSC